jgi:hypothetical protein
MNYSLIATKLRNKISRFSGELSNRKYLDFLLLILYLNKLFQFL